MNAERTGYRIVKTQSHRARAQLKSAAPGVIGPYWVGGVRNGKRSASIFDRLSAEFWLVPLSEMTERVTRIKGASFPVQIEAGDLHPWGGLFSDTERVPSAVILFRLEYLRGELRAERISYDELIELQGMVGEIDPSDVELLEAAGVPEHADEETDPAREHSPVHWHTPGVWPSCSCGVAPRDNAKLTAHWAEHGIRWVDDHGKLTPYPLESSAPARVRIERTQSDEFPQLLTVGREALSVTLDDLRALAGLLATFDLTSSAASQHYIETGELSTHAEIAAANTAPTRCAACGMLIEHEDGMGWIAAPGALDTHDDGHAHNPLLAGAPRDYADAIADRLAEPQYLDNDEWLRALLATAAREGYALGFGAAQ